MRDHVQPCGFNYSLTICIPTMSARRLPGQNSMVSCGSLNGEGHRVALFRIGYGKRTLRQAVAELSGQLAGARREIEIVDLARENAALKMALAHERKQQAAAKVAPASQ
jgi:hypothetical protein